MKVFVVDLILFFLFLYIFQEVERYTHFQMHCAMKIVLHDKNMVKDKLIKRVEDWESKKVRFMLAYCYNYVFNKDYMLCSV